MTGDVELPRALARDPGSAALPGPERAMVDYALKLTRTPASVDAADVDALREAGFDDTAILDICQVVSYYAYVNRLADGLGVELESWWRDEDLTITRSEMEERSVGRQP